MCAVSDGRYKRLPVLRRSRFQQLQVLQVFHVVHLVTLGLLSWIRRANDLSADYRSRHPGAPCYHGLNCEPAKENDGKRTLQAKP